MKMLSKYFTPWGVIIIAVLATVVWFVWAVEQAYADDIPVRAITAAQHSSCADMPRGSQEMEEERHECFRKLYGQGRWKRTD